VQQGDTKSMAKELTEDDLLTIRKVLIKDIIIDLRKALIRTDNIQRQLSLTQIELEGIEADVKTTINRLYQILNEAIS